MFILVGVMLQGLGSLDLGVHSGGCDVHARRTVHSAAPRTVAHDACTADSLPAGTRLPPLPGTSTSTLDEYQHPVDTIVPFRVL